LIIDPSNPATVFAATSTGIFKTANGGDSWSAANSGVTGASVSALAIAPSSPATLYVGSYDSGVFRSTNGGASWTAISNGLPGHATALAVDSSNPATVYAGIGGAGVAGGSGDGVYKSTDGGASWNAVNNGIAASPRGVHALAIAPSDPSVLYMATGGGGEGLTAAIYSSTNAGADWTASTGLPANAPTNVLAIDPSNPATVYAGTNGSGIFKSTDGGASWAAVNTGLPANDFVALHAFITALVVDPSNPATLYVSFSLAGGLYKSTDGGANWSPANSGLPAAIVGHVAIDPANPATLYAATGVGVFKTNDGGMSWKSANNGLRNAVNTLAVSSSGNSTTVYAGTSGAGVFQSTDGGASWQPTGTNQD